MPVQSEKSGIYQKPAELLQKLIRFNTTNPPGNEAESIKFLNDLMSAAGFQTIMTGMTPERQNLVVRMEGRGDAPPFLMYGHIDVVTVEHQDWKNPPFDGIIADDCVWGRGALDMKGALVMMICAMLRMKAEDIIPPGDIILAVVCDEEDAGTYGAKFIVEKHRELFKDVRCAIGEVGGFTMHMGGKRFYPIMIAEKQKCSLKTLIKGPGGHGSMPMHGGAMARLGSMLNKLDTCRLPVHVTQPVKQMIEALAANMEFPASVLLKSLLIPSLTDSVLKLMGEKGKFLDPILHNSVNATIVYGGDKINVIPSEITVELDGRILPGYTREDMLGELKALLGDEYEFDVSDYYPGPTEINMELFDMLSDILREGDSEGIPIPFVVSGVTDARYFSKLGIQTYGFTPMLLPEGLDFSKLIHGADERIPVKALEFGTDAIFKLLHRFNR